MAFNNIKIVGDGTAQIAVTNTDILEAVSTGLIAYNTTDGVLSFTLLIDGVVIITEEVAATSSYRLPDKVNIPVNTVLTINAPIGVDITLSSYQSPIDTLVALTSVQQAVQDTNADVIATNADVVLTHADVVLTAADVVSATEILADISAAPLWVSGTDYIQYSVVTDTINYKTYKANIEILDSVVEPSASGDWNDISSGGSATFWNTSVTATDGQTTFSITYTPGLIAVFRNGIKLPEEDFTATDGAEVVLTVGADLDDLLEFQVFSSFSIANTYSIVDADQTFSTIVDNDIQDTLIDTKLNLAQAHATALSF